MVNLEEEAFKKLLQQKFQLFRNLMHTCIEHPMTDARISIEQARRLSEYAHATYFRHLRLYDFVLKNTKLSEVKRVYLPVPEPKCGEELSKAITLYDSEQAKQQQRLADTGMGAPTSSGYGDHQSARISEHQASKDGFNRSTGGAEGAAGAEAQAESSATDSDMEALVKHAPVERKIRNTTHRVAK